MSNLQHLKVERFGEKLRALRRRHNMSLAELAYKLGYADTSNISRIEPGKKGATIELVLKVSKRN